MKTALKWILRLLLLAALGIGGLALWKREEAGRLMAVLSLFSEKNIVRNFSNMDQIFLHTPLATSDAAISPLPYGTPITLPADVANWAAERAVTGLVILKDGAIVFEDYNADTNDTDLRINWSISKSYLSALFGILFAEGVFESLEDPVTAYAPELADTAYRNATIKDVLQMSSGVSFDEDYLDFFSDINKMGRILALGGSMDGFAGKQKTSFAAPGTEWKYVSIDTHVIGMVIREATGRPIAELLAEKIIGPLGLEAAPYYLTDGYRVAFVLGGLNTTTRDNARFGQMMANGGMWNRQQIVPANWVDASTQASAKTAPGEIGYGYQWWVPTVSAPGQFLARGIYGQYIYIDRINNVVIAVHAADRQFREPGIQAQNEAMFRQIAESLN
ncbi:serine hydrolase [Yoonia sp. SS1-5]|uniref:Serine hydrolase domain-containing protein n=1 Tax=Yoonia rhodophyticola TaxID=3137370 RepID=A0AAN0NIC4_9RHOB